METVNAGVQPQQDPGVSSGWWPRRKDSKERTGLDLPWLTQKANIAPGTELALFTEATGALSVGWGCRTPPPRWRRRAPSRSGLRSPGKKVNSESPCAPRSHPERSTERENEGKGKKRTTRGDQASVSEAHNFIFKRNFYTLTPWLVHRGKWKMQSHTESAQTLHLFCLYQNQDFFCIPFP